MTLGTSPVRLLEAVFPVSGSEDRTQDAVLAASLDLLPASTVLIVVRGMILTHFAALRFHLSNIV